jgi:hypothetical protein
MEERKGGVGIFRRNEEVSKRRGELSNSKLLLCGARVIQDECES